MKKTIILSIAIITFGLGSCNSSPKTTDESSSNTLQNFNLDTMSLKSGETFYQCPMDLEVISDKQGVCPKCGMELEKEGKK